MSKYILTLLIFLLTLLSCRTNVDFPKGSDLQKFDSNFWKSDSSLIFDKSLITPRQKMLKDLIVNILPGKSKKQIEELLGESLKTEYFISIQKDFIYYLGPERGGFMNIDSEWLLIWLNENGKYKRFELAND